MMVSAAGLQTALRGTGNNVLRGGHSRNEVLDGCLQWSSSKGFEVFLQVGRVARSSRGHLDNVGEEPKGFEAVVDDSEK